MTIRFGVLGAARISNKALYHPANDTDGVALEAIVARDRSRAEEHAAEYGIPRVLDSYEELLADPDIDAIYNPLPVSLHHTWTIAALAAGKHVLSEKPFAANADLARQIVAAEKQSGTICMEAYHWRFHPLADRIREVLDGGALGEIEHVDAVFDVYIRPDDDVRHSYDLAGGALMDLGCYPVQWGRFVMPGEEPTVVSAVMQTGRPNSDVDTTINVEYPNGATGVFKTKMTPDTPFKAELVVRGSSGMMRVTNPLAPHNGNRLEVDSLGIDEEVAGRTTYHHQMEAFIDVVNNGAPMVTGRHDAIATMELIDAAYLAAGLPLRQG